MSRIERGIVWKSLTNSAPKAKPTKFGVYNIMEWTIYAGVVAPNNVAVLKGITKQLFNNERDIIDYISTIVMPITAAYETGLTMENYGYSFVDSHQKGSPHKVGAVTIYECGKNVGKKNQTNAYTQARNEAEKKYEKKALVSEYYGPMLAEGSAILAEVESEYLSGIYDKSASYEKKLDGLRCLAQFDGSKIEFYSRDLKPVLVGDRIIREIPEIFAQINRNKYKVVLDGELYSHGMSLSEISGKVRNALENGKSIIKYHVFDMFFLCDGRPTKLTVSQRRVILNAIKPTESIVITEQYHPANAAELVALYRQVLADGFEGLMMKLDVSYNNDSRKYMYKLKPEFQEEFRIIGYSDGKGKDAGLIKFKCELTADVIRKGIEYKKLKNGIHIDLNTALENPKTFNVRPADTDDNRRELYKKMKVRQGNGKTYFEQNYLGSLYTVNFQDYSDNLVPLRPVGVGVRE